MLGESLGTGVTGAILAFAVRAAIAPAAPLAVAFGIGLAVGLVALLLTVRLPERSVAAATSDHPDVEVVRAA